MLGFRTIRLRPSFFFEAPVVPVPRLQDVEQDPIPPSLLHRLTAQVLATAGRSHRDRRLFHSTRWATAAAAKQWPEKMFAHGLTCVRPTLRCGGGHALESWESGLALHQCNKAEISADF